MTQSRRASLTESLSNVAIGYVVALGVGVGAVVRVVVAVMWLQIITL